MQPARKPSAEPENFAVDPREIPAPAPVADGAPHPSPARSLQQLLRDRWSADPLPDDGRRWAPRSTLMFSGAVALLFWGAVAGLVAASR